MVKLAFVSLLVMGHVLTIVAQVPKFSFYINSNYSAPIIEDETLQVLADPVFYTGYNQIYSNIGGIKRESEAKFGFEAGGNISWEISNKFSLVSGIGVNVIRYNQKENVETNDSGLDNIIISGGIISQDTTLTGQSLWQRDSSGYLIVGNIDLSGYNLLQNENNGVDYSLTYLKIPLLGRYAITKKIGVTLGANFSFLLASKREYTQSYFSLNTYFEMEHKDKSTNGYNNTLIGITGGIDFMLFKNFEINVNYNRSLNSIYITSDWNSTNYNATNNSLSLGLSYFLSPKINKVVK
ncbi:MAG: PorT family protein [Cyclobacteriaceae bacterium]|nr:PorT family protein [Cyclobacteriaceae bacterium]